MDEDNFLGAMDAPAAPQEAPAAPVDFGDAMGVDAAVPEVPTTTQPIDLDELAGPGGAAAPQMDAPMEDIGAAFIDAYIPAAVQEPDHTPEVVDPRVAWRKKNAEALKAKDADEAKAKKAFADKAQEHLKKVKEAREKQLGNRKTSNRANAKVSSSEAGVPQEGSSWDKVNALVAVAAGTHQKDVTRFKTTLISLKTVKA